jgi:hypothetical protein
MTRKPRRVALYVRVSTDGQTTEDQRRELVEVAERHSWDVNGGGISGARRHCPPEQEAEGKRSARVCC